METLSGPVKRVDSATGGGDRTWPRHQRRKFISVTSWWSKARKRMQDLRLR